MSAYQKKKKNVKEFYLNGKEMITVRNMKTTEGKNLTGKSKFSKVSSSSTYQPSRKVKGQKVIK